MEDETKYKFFPTEIGYYDSEDRVYADDELKEELMNLAIKQRDYLSNVGLRIDRLEYDSGDLENSFHRNWLKENEPISYLNYGGGVLKDLMVKPNPKGVLFDNTTYYDITPRDRRIVATVVQWLGTNIGFSFLSKCLKDCGYEITKIK